MFDVQSPWCTSVSHQMPEKKVILSSPSPKADATPVFGHRTYFYEKSQKYLRQCKITNVMKNTSKTKIHTQSNTDTDIRSQTYTTLYHNQYSQSIVENIFTPEKVQFSTLTTISRITKKSLCTVRILAELSEFQQKMDGRQSLCCERKTERKGK